MRRGKLWWALAAALIAPMLLATPGQAATNDKPTIVAATGAPVGAGNTALAPVDKATAKALDSKLGNGSGAIAPAATCAQASYIQVFDPATGQRLITVAPGNTIRVHAFTILRHQGVMQPGTQALFQYRWNNDTAGFDYITTAASSNCVLREEPNTLSSQRFPVGNLVSVSVCFAPWELGGNDFVCGPLGFINRFF